MRTLGGLGRALRRVGGLRTRPPAAATTPAVSARTLVALLLIGLVVRVPVAWLSVGIIHPDEHQQYIEQGFRIAHGYGAVFWEQERGMRHPLLPTLLGGLLLACDRVGIADPHAQAVVIRLSLALASFGALAYLAWTLFRGGRRVAALALAFLLSASVDLAFMHVRVLSESAAAVALTLALATWPRRPLACGLFLGIMVTFRLQTAPFAAGLWTAAAWAGWREGTARPTARLTLGLSLALVAAGLHDLAYHGTFFHSAWANLTAQWAEGGADQFGLSPWWHYLVEGVLTLLRVSVFAVALFAWGVRCRPDVGWAAFLLVLAHSLIGHKEFRFLWPLAPAVALLLAAAVEDLYRRGVAGRGWVLAVLAASVLGASVLRAPGFEWEEEHYAASAWALAKLGRHDDVTGVAVVGIPRWACGNYFYLRRRVPIECAPEGTAVALAGLPGWADGRLNYYVVPRGLFPPAVAAALVLVAENGEWVIYRLK
jgi:hypothetical protein